VASESDEKKIKSKPIKINNKNMLNIFFNTIYNDAPEPWRIGFQDSAAPGFDGIVRLHDSIFYFLILISVGVF
jgi:hypothetical protein